MSFLPSFFSQTPPEKTQTAVNKLPLLCLEQVSVGWHNDQPCHEPISFHLSRGQILALTGDNGAGKSSLLMLINQVGQHDKTANSRIKLTHGNINVCPTLRLVMYSQDSLNSTDLPLTARELLHLTQATITNLPPWLTPLLDHRLDRLSGGQRHFFGLWGIVASPCDVIVLDEPTNHLDKFGVAWLANTLHTCTKNGQAILIVTHDKTFLNDLSCQQIKLTKAENLCQC